MDFVERQWDGSGTVVVRQVEYPLSRISETSNGRRKAFRKPYESHDAHNGERL